MNTTLVEFVRSDVETGDWFLSYILEKCWLVKGIGSAGIAGTLPQETHVTQPIAHGVGVGHSRNPFPNVYVNCEIVLDVYLGSALEVRRKKCNE